MNIISAFQQEKIGWLVFSAILFVAGCQGEPFSENKIRELSLDRVTSSNNFRAAVISPNTSFSEALLAAAQANPAFKSAKASAEAVMAEAKRTEGVIRPQIAASANIGAGIQGDSLTKGASSGITWSQLLYDGGSAKSSINIGRTNSVRALVEVEIAGNTAARKAGAAWIDLWAATSRLTMLQEQIASLQPQIDQIDRLVSSGLVDRTIADQARGQLFDIKYEEEQLKTAKASAKARFAQYFGIVPATVRNPTNLMSTGDLAKTAKMWSDAPTLVAAAASIIVAEHELSVAQAAFAPTVRFQAAALSPKTLDDSGSLNIGIGVTYGFSDGGQRKARVRSKEAQIKALTLALDEIKLEGQRTIKIALSRQTSLKTTLKNLVSQEAIMANKAQIVRSQLQSGQSDVKSVIGAELDLYRVQSRIFEIRSELFKLELQILDQTGQLLSVLRNK